MEPFQAIGLALVVAAIVGGGLETAIQTAAPAATSAPAGRTPILPSIRKDGDRRP
jgi:hypothetical protein